MARTLTPDMLDAMIRSRPKRPVRSPLGGLGTVLSAIDSVDKIEKVGEKIAQVGDNLLSAHKVKNNLEADPGQSLPAVRWFLLIGLAFVGGWFAREIFSKVEYEK